MNTFVDRFITLRPTHRALYTSALLFAGTIVLFAAGIWLDPRYLGGAPVWLKPTKFALSLAMYSASMLWILSLLRGKDRLVRFAGFWIAAVSALELGIIALQAARDVLSHYNTSTPLDGALYSAMGIAIGSLWLLHLVITVLVMRQKLENPVLSLSLRLGLVLTLIGMAEAFLMTSPSATQMATLQSGGLSSIIGAHSVGVSDGGAGLPVVGWSTRGGDLRIGHFMGIHALQLLPLLGWLLAGSGRLLERQKTQLVWVASLGYLGTMALTTVQALRGQSIVAPDSLTITLGGGLLMLGVGAAAWILRGARAKLNKAIE